MLSMIKPITCQWCSEPATHDVVVTERSKTKPMGVSAPACRAHYDKMTAVRDRDAARRKKEREELRLVGGDRRRKNKRYL